MNNTNSLHDEIRLQQQKLKEETFSNRMKYYWHYYKVHAIVIICLALMFGSILHSIITQKETVLSIAYINAFPNVDDETLAREFEDFLKINTKKQQVVLDSTYYIDDDSSSPYAATYRQKFSTHAMAGELDVVLADAENFDFYGGQGFFQNLESILPANLLKQYENDLYYVDIVTEDSTSRVAVGIKINEAAKLSLTESYPNTDAYLGIMAGSDHVDNALRYLYYLEN